MHDWVPGERLEVNPAIGDLKGNSLLDCLASHLLARWKSRKTLEHHSAEAIDASRIIDEKGDREDQGLQEIATGGGSREELQSHRDFNWIRT